MLTDRALKFGASTNNNRRGKVESWANFHLPVLTVWFRGLTVMTADSDSASEGSTPSETFLLLCLSISYDDNVSFFGFLCGVL